MYFFRPSVSPPNRPITSCSGHAINLRNKPPILNKKDIPDSLLKAARPLVKAPDIFLIVGIIPLKKRPIAPITPALPRPAAA